MWGVLNVTPDSFYDGGRFFDRAAAIAHARRLIAEGANVIDVGGESSRPPGVTYGAGAVRVAVDDELARVVPVIEALASETTVSVDTVKPEVARAALAAGARVVNDVSCGASTGLMEAAAEAGADLVLMHSRDGGRVDASTTGYTDVVSEVRDELLSAVDRAVSAGVGRASIWIDPGIGFAKTHEQSIILLGNLDVLVSSGYPVLVGASRKSFIARTLAGAGLGEPASEQRLGGSLAVVAAAVMSGCRGVRVHDVYESVQAARIAEAMRDARKK